jgi:hypothetical protein
MRQKRVGNSSGSSGTSMVKPRFPGLAARFVPCRGPSSAREPSYVSVWFPNPTYIKPYLYIVREPGNRELERF